jgi:hypothetical protein
MLNGIWVTSRKREQPKSIATYVCPGCGDEIIAAPGRVVYCWFCWFDSGYRERLLCQEQMERAA